MTIPDARKFVGQQIGLPVTFDGSIAAYRELSAAQQTALTAQLIKFIVANPGQFTAGQVAYANSVIGRAETMAIQDETFNVGEFFTALGESLNDVVLQPVADLGQGLSNTVSGIGKALPWIVAGAVLIFALPYIVKNFKTA